MSSFEERWAECARAARTARAGDTPPGPSWAGIRRSLTAIRQEAAEGGESMEWWRWYAVRGVGLATLLVVACLLFATRGPGLGHPLRPEVENAVAEVLWLL